MRGKLSAILLGAAAVALIAVALAGCGSDGDSSSAGSTTEAAAAPEESTSTKPKVVVPSGPAPTELVSRDLVEGTGPVAKTGDTVTVQYVGVDYKTGEQFDASWDRGEPYTFPLGAGEVIPGWDQGVVGMKVGGRRELIIPPELAYGPQQVGPIAPNSTLVFVVDLVAVE